MPVLVQVAQSQGIPESQLRARLTEAGLPSDGDDSIAARVGSDARRQIQVLASVLATRPAGRA